MKLVHPEFAALSAALGAARLPALAAQVDIDAEARAADAFGVDSSPVVKLLLEGREAATYGGDPTWCAPARRSPTQPSPLACSLA